MRKSLVKVIATLGPTSSNLDTVVHMMEMGVDVFRINMSHGGPESWSELLSLIEAAESKLGVRVGIAADLEGPRIRTGNESPIRLSKGDTVILGYRSGDIPVTSKEFFDSLEEGDIVLIDDGKVVLQIDSVEGLTCKARVVEEGVIGPRKGVVVRRKEVGGTPVTKRDRESLAFASDKPFSHVYVSYARSYEHVDSVRGILKRLGREDVRVYAKIESPQGVNRVGEIVDASDGIIVARGDLGMHYSLEELPEIQERIVWEARRRNKPVVLATEFLSSMLEKPVPLRSEIFDIYHAVWMNADALMLTSETAIGKYPLKAVMWTQKIVSRAVDTLREKRVWRPQPTNALYRLALGLVELSESLNATLIIYSMTGRLAERIASFRPLKSFYVGVPSDRVERVVRGLWGAEPVRVEASSYEEGLRKTAEKLEKEGVIGSGDVVVQAAWSHVQGSYSIVITNISV